MSHAPAHALKRVGLDGGEEEKIELSEPVARLALTGLDHRPAIEAGRVTLNVGFAVDDMRATSEVEITGSSTSLCARPRAAEAQPPARQHEDLTRCHPVTTATWPAFSLMGGKNGSGQRIGQSGETKLPSDSGQNEFREQPARARALRTLILQGSRGSFRWRWGPVVTGEARGAVGDRGSCPPSSAETRGHRLLLHLGNHAQTCCKGPKWTPTQR